MESFLKMSLRIFAITCVFIYSMQVFAGFGTSPSPRSEDSEGDTRAIPPPGPIPGPRPIILRPNLVNSKFTQLLRTDTTIKALHQDLLNRGFQAQTSLNNHWGFRGLFKGKDDKGKSQNVRTSFFLREYISIIEPNDLAALVQVQMGSRKFSFFLIALNGDFDNAIEFARGLDGEISEKHAAGFWHCMWHGLSGIGGTCANALITCPHTGWAAYAGCVALRCGGAAFTRLACCACDCRFWCRWAVGCCDR